MGQWQTGASMFGGTVGSERKHYKSWACGSHGCNCQYCMGVERQIVSDRYFCRPGYYNKRRNGFTKYDHENLLYFKDLESLEEHRMLHWLDGALLEGSLEGLG